MYIGHFEVPGPRALLIAEIGINHNGDLETAKKLIAEAKSAGADMVKFQKRDIPTIYTPQELEKPRDVPREFLEQAILRGVLPESIVERLQNSNFTDTRTHEQKLMLEFTASEYRAIDEYCRKIGILWFASPWDEASVDFLEQYDPPCYKVASASLTDDDLLRYMRQKNRPLILSTGMADLPMIRHAIEVLGQNDLVILHCTSVYSAASDETGLRLINLRGIQTLAREFPDVPVGFSSHDLGIQPSYAAATLGAVMIEKHITLNRGMYGSDQNASIEIPELSRLARMLKDLPVALGDGEIRFYDAERAVAKKLRRK